MDRVNSIQTKHFHLEQPADGAYAAIHADDGWAICNAGFVDLGDHTLVFDAFITPAAAADLRMAAEQGLSLQSFFTENLKFLIQRHAKP